MTPLCHVMILASAGAGKTYALTNRFIGLLARGAPPERIIALTFTRKAAGEFFDEILTKLARAAGEDAAAARLAEDLGAPHLAAGDFLRLLRGMVDAMHRLRLGTLDSFFARIARVFPFELGLSGEFEVIEEHAASVERQRVLRRMFTRVGELETAQKEFIEAFKRATFGAEEKQLGPKLDRFLDAHQERYLEAREAHLWGEAAGIWPEGNAWFDAKIDRDAALGTLGAWATNAGLGDKQRERWQALFAAIAAWAPGMAPPRAMEYVLTKAIAAWPDLVAGHAVLEFDRKKQELSGVACEALADLTRHVVGGELSRRLATTRGIHAVLRGYDAVYHESVRRAGRLTFGDIQRLLLPDGGAGVLTSDAGGEGRLFIDYRLDAEIDHWLLDEFQDTSYGQWSVLKNLIDEVVQDTSGRRSFFCVGDVKQAIFAWREGDSRLFGEIFRYYNTAAPGAVTAEHLDRSWRSGPAIIEMVNAVFGAAPAIGGLFPGAASESWNDDWRPHVSAFPQRAGQAALIWAADEDERWKRMLEILHEIRPIERGLTCAILVPKNSTATALADYLRREGGLPAVAESDLHVCTDNPMGAALLALMQAAAYPGDTMAWEHVQMTPLASVLAEEGITTREAATWRVLTAVHADGFERAIEVWLRQLESRLDGGDGFNRTRARQFAAAAARYDQSGGRSVAEFIQFMERHVVRDPEGADVVRVMTIHKSKGLGFDVVILPDLQGKRIDSRREGLAVQKAADRTVEWILDLPPKLFYEADDVLSRHVRAAEAEACHEALSLLYVALTRAKRAMYAIVEPPGNSVSRNHPKLLAETLGDSDPGVPVGDLRLSGGWSSGDPRWHHSVVAASKPVAPISALGPLSGWEGEPVIHREARRPSGETPGRIPAAQLFSLDQRRGADFGAAVHALLAEVEWGGEAECEHRERLWRERGGVDAVREEALACLRARELQPIWARQSGAEVWRERAFEIVIDGTWVTGVFDRVVVEREESGRPKAATVFDFKTDRLAGANDRAMAAALGRHAAQLHLYRRVAATLLELPMERVACEMVLTQLPRRMAVPVS